MNTNELKEKILKSVEESLKTILEGECCCCDGGGGDVAIAAPAAAPVAAPSFGGAVAPMSTPFNTIGIGNPVPAGMPAMTAAQQASDAELGSGDLFLPIMGIATKKGPQFPWVSYKKPVARRKKKKSAKKS